MMLSNPSSAIERRRTMHRRQNSTPVLEAPHAPQIPAPLRRTNSHRRGMSLDQTTYQGPYSPRPLITNLGTIAQADASVSIDNHPGHQDPQHPMPQQQCIAQPGTQYRPIQPMTQDHHQGHEHQLHHPGAEHQKQPLHINTDMTSLPPPQAEPEPLSPAQKLKDLEQHIKDIYGPDAQIQVNILPSPTASPQKQATMPAPEHLDLAPMPTSFDDFSTGLSLEPGAENTMFKMGPPENDLGYESSYYSSPSSSPPQHHVPTFLDGVEPAPRLSFTSGLPLLPPSQSMSDFDMLMSPSRSTVSPRPMSVANLSLEATIQDTGISIEEVEQYIGDLKEGPHKFYCTYPSCGKTFARKENVKSHIQTHLGDRQFRCIHCGKCFVRQHDLKRHAKIHTGSKPYKCACGQGFARQDALTRHRQRGTCEGGFPNAVRSQARRGRPKKKRPEMEDRLDKARRTREADTYASSSSGASAAPSPLDDFNTFDSAPLCELDETEGAVADMSSPCADYAPASSPPPAQSDDFGLGVLVSHTPPESPEHWSAFSSPAKSSDLPSAAFTTPPTSPPNYFDFDSASGEVSLKEDMGSEFYAAFQESSAFHSDDYFLQME